MSDELFELMKEFARKGVEAQRAVDKKLREAAEAAERDRNAGTHQDCQEEEE